MIERWIRSQASCRMLCLVLMSVFGVSPSAAFNDEKMRPTTSCQLFLANFSKSTWMFNASRHELTGKPQRFYPSAVQITNWPELQAAYDCEDGLFTGISTSLLDDSSEVFDQFVISAIGALHPQLDREEMNVIVGDLYAKGHAQSSRYAELPFGNYVALLRVSHPKRFSIELRYKEDKAEDSSKAD